MISSPFLSMSHQALRGSLSQSSPKYLWYVFRILCIGLVWTSILFNAQPSLAQCEEDSLALIEEGVTNTQGHLQSEDSSTNDNNPIQNISLNIPLIGGVSPERYLRAITLDLLGRLPTTEEYQELEDHEGMIDESILVGWLSTSEFAEQAARFHQSLLWNNLSNLNLYNNNPSLRVQNGIYWRNAPAQRYRGERISCLDELARFGSDGEILTTAVGEANLEGWVWVNPYWSPNERIKVCAFDAQDAIYSSQGNFCGSTGGMNSTDCGCGPELRWCVTNNVRQEMTRSLKESLDLLIQWIFLEGDSYIDLFESRRFYINGPLAHFFQHHTQVGRYTFNPSPISSELIPNITYTELDRWVPMILSREHAGILTHPAFLLRFQTNRSRANRFFDAFLCSPFQPPDGGLPVADEEASRNPDLQLRAGCKYCHALLEPAASYWGRWTQQGISYLSPDDFPPERQDCLNCALTGQGCTNECRTHYLTSSLSEQELPYLGKLKAYTFRREEHTVNVERGPRLLAFTEVAEQRLPRCVAQRTAEWLLARSTNNERDQSWIDSLGITFARSGFNYKTLVSEIITNERYRRVK